MSNSAKVISLTLLILVLAGSIAGIMFFYGKSSVISHQSSAADGQTTVDRRQTTDVVAGLASTSTEIWSSVAVGQKMNNPFMFKMRAPFKSTTWMLQDANGKILASGFVSSTGETIDVTGWYSQAPKTKTGWFLMADSLSSAMPPYRIPVELQTKFETVEAYFANPKESAGDSCDSVYPVKRTIVSTDGDVLSHYQAALYELTKGPTQQEKAQGYTTALPEGVDVIRVGQDESGRFVGDFPAALTAGIVDRCRLSLIRAQIQETLKTVPLQGRTLKGRVYVEGVEYLIN